MSYAHSSKRWCGSEVEQRTRNAQAVGSIPTISSIVEKPVIFDCHRFFIAQNFMIEGYKQILGIVFDDTISFNKKNTLFDSSIV